MNHAEQRIHIAIVQWIRTVSPSTMLWHTPNGGWRSPRSGALLKAMGTLPGVFDLALVSEPPGPCLAFLEVKADRKQLSPEQVEFSLRLGHFGIPRAIVRSIDDVRIAFQGWHVPMREAVQRFGNNAIAKMVNAGQPIEEMVLETGEVGGHE